MCGYDGPIYMTHPTKAICPILLEDYRKISVERKGETNFFTSQMIKDCMKKVVAVNLHQTIHVDDDLEIKAYYAGHVLGAAMFYVRVGQESVVYTGDYNMTPDRHLGSAWIDKVRPDVLITETTYATTIRDSKRSRERDFLKKVHDCVQNGGNVIIPVFALGRAQELCILIETYWERMDLKVPIYFSAGLTEKANHYYKLFINWTNEKIKSTFVQRNMFDFKHIKAWDRNYLEMPGPMVLFATPGMLHIGTSLEVFKKWAPDPKNMVILPGFCVAGTVGAKVLEGQKKIDVDKFTTIDVNLQVRNLSFSAHADAKGIMQLIRQCEPRNVVLVHGEKGKMGFLKSKIMKEFGVPCFDPANGQTVSMDTSRAITADMSVALLKKHLAGRPIELNFLKEIEDAVSSTPVERQIAVEQIRPRTAVPIQGVMVMTEEANDDDDHRPRKVRIVDPDSAVQDSRLPSHDLQFDLTRPFNATLLQIRAAEAGVDVVDVKKYALNLVYTALVRVVGGEVNVERAESKLKVRSVLVYVPDEDGAGGNALKVRWSYRDEDLANRVLAVVNLTLLS
ncbi:beta-lactamase-like protein [Jimgerdemannia flammicorona]|uniref:Beta-lactamase-like protein n=1 Tax=Jimgerdemannia flammicorona TaxID=994334 RepID=A0A433DI21_9FUNG|nr:beta-lactamase-like protein [Jimgerdemannia flammicorona]